MRHRADDAGRGNGFTLIELALVLVIISIFASLAWPRLVILGNSRLEHSARRLATVLSYLHDEAALRGRVYRLSLDLDHHLYRVDVEERTNGEDGRPTFTESLDPAMAPTALPEGVSLISVESATQATFSGVAEIYFLPEDTLPGVNIEMQSREGGSVHLAMDGTSGHVRRTQNRPAS